MKWIQQCNNIKINVPNHWISGLRRLKFWILENTFQKLVLFPSSGVCWVP
jgi:hypothetical protein